MLINKTESYCCECGGNHEAHVESVKGKIYFKVFCPVKIKNIKISNDADIFLNIRKKSYAYLNSQEKSINSWDNHIEITNDCNFDCPVCFTNGGENKDYYLTVDEIVKRAKFLKKKNRKLMTLSGGEPTLHPKLLKIIKECRRAGMTVKILTNGLLLGENPGLAKQLKKNKIEYCYIQFDSLNEETHLSLRNNNTIDSKKKALHNAKEAGLLIGTITMFLKNNLTEIGSLIEYFINFTPNLSVAAFLCAADSTGRFKIKKDDIVDREDIIKGIIKSGVVTGISVDNFWPYPRFLPIGMNLHPDCAVLLYLAVNNGKIEPLDNYINFKKLYKLMGKAKLRNKVYIGYFLFILYLLKSVRKNKVFQCFKMLTGYLTKTGKHSIMIISIEQFMNEHYQDIQRINHCTTFITLENDEMVPICVYNHPDKRMPGPTRKKITKR